MLLNYLGSKPILYLFLNFPRSVATKKKKKVLARFNCWPETFSYTASNLCNSSHSFNVALQKIKLSSAKKKQMRQSWAPSTNFYSLHLTSIHCWLNQSRQAFCTQKEKVRWQKVSLTNPLWWNNASPRCPINFNWISNCRNTSHDQIPHPVSKAQFLHNFVKPNPLYPITSFTHI